MLFRLLLLALPLAAQFPIRSSPDAHGLVTDKGKPFLYLADTAWPLLYRAHREDAELYLADRARRGFNTIHIQLLLPGEPAKNAYGDWPLGYEGQSHDDLSLPNPSFFAHLDWLLKRASSHGLQLAIAPLWLDCCSRRQDREKVREFGRYLGRRYLRSKNLLWILGGEGLLAGDLPLLRALAEGIREFDGVHLITAYPNTSSSARTDYGPQPWLGLNTLRIDAPALPAAAQLDFARQPALPFVLLASPLEAEPGASPQALRQQAWWSILSGAAGYTHGAKTIAVMNSGWSAALDSAGVRHLTHWRNILQKYEWWRLRPDFDGHCLQSQAGASSSSLPALCDPEGKLLLTYLHAGQPPRLPARLASWKLIWVDPTDGLEKPRGPKNAAGEEDWILILKQ